MIKMIRAKLHGIRVTDSNLNYRGSITLDPVLCRKAGIYPLEYVYIWNKTNGERTSTYVIYGEPGSGCCVLNGASARRCQIGDEVIIGASLYVNTPDDICAVKPTVLIFGEGNKVIEVLKYDAHKDDVGDFHFSMVPAE